MGFCLRQEETRKFIEALKNDKIDPEKMAEMSSKERRDFFKEIVGEENAADVNRLFETKLLLKNQQKAMVAWVETTLGERHPAKKDILSRIQRMDKILDAPDRQKFLEDLASHRLGTAVTFDEAKTISELAGKATEMKEKLDAGTLPDRLEYGRAQVALNNYVNELKLNAGKMTWAEIKNSPFKAMGKLAEAVAGNAKAIEASMDNSAIFRQGWKTLWTHPGTWAKNSIASFRHLFKYHGQEEVLNELNADIISRPTYDLMQKAKLDVGVNEEAFPTALPEKIPGLGRVYKASENAYTAFVRKTRADVFDKYIEIAKSTNVDLNDDELRSIGKMVNALTGRGDLGALEQVGKGVNSFFFSPKFFKSQIDVLTQPLTGAGGSAFVRKQAAINLVKIVAGTAAILTIARALKPDSVELDPRSADFGKIKVGNTRFDVTGGMGSIITLAARFATMSSKSSVTGEIRNLNERDENGKIKFGTQRGDDLIADFLENKLSPVAQVALERLKDETRSGDRPTLANQTTSLFTPLPVKTGVELYKDPNSANWLASMILDGLGVAANTYGGAKATEQQLRTAALKGDKDETAKLGIIMQTETQKMQQKMQEAKAGGDGENYIKLRQQFLDTFGGSKEISKAMEEARKARNPDEFNRLKEILVKVEKLEDEKKREKDLRDRDKEIQEKKQK